MPVQIQYLPIYSFHVLQAMCDFTRKHQPGNGPLVSIEIDHFPMEATSIISKATHFNNWSQLWGLPWFTNIYILSTYETFLHCCQTNPSMNHSPRFKKGTAGKSLQHKCWGFLNGSSSRGNYASFEWYFKTCRDVKVTSLNSNPVVLNSLIWSFPITAMTGIRWIFIPFLERTFIPLDDSIRFSISVSYHFQSYNISTSRIASSYMFSPPVYWHYLICLKKTCHWNDKC
jgi:hypothetical protein